VHTSGTFRSISDTIQGPEGSNHPRLCREAILGVTDPNLQPQTQDSQDKPRILRGLDFARPSPKGASRAKEEAHPLGVEAPHRRMYRGQCPRIRSTPILFGTRNGRKMEVGSLTEAKESPRNAVVK